MSELANKQLALRWFEYAKNDLQAALIILSSDDAAPRVACFLAQQSAEKALKSILVLKGLDVIRTHDLDAISEKLPKKESEKFESFDLAWLTEWNVEARYPGDWPEASFEDAEKAVTIATEVLNVCNSIFINED
ncbi:MAG: HEPN domain-containing protein [Clostridiales bacterium]|jgi:HEPN domain-containing protein|nr:HEPN domain-containing protein [Clostridiales bacterium]HOC07966.1 HEPN domain-containing protein [Bacillota bacterium]HQA47581.1 HEPN domain-containing protein [Bacillota bacterium]